MGVQIITEEIKSIRKLIPKFATFDISNNHVKGKVIIQRYRKYSFHQEVDVVFEGEIFVRIGRGQKTNWQTSNVLKQYNISKIKLNRFLRNSIYKDVSIRMKYFGADIRYSNDIKKINWK